MPVKGAIFRLWEKLKWHYETKRTKLLYGWRLAHIGHGAVIERGASLIGCSRIRVGDRTRICESVCIDARLDNSHIDIGNDVRICGHVYIDAAYGFVEIGNDVYIGSYTIIGGHGGCKIGDDCQIASYCYFIAANHKFDRADQLIRLQDYSIEGIDIGQDCWFGNGATVLDGVTIGNGCVIAAKGVVTKDAKPYSVLAGIPTKVIRMRGNMTFNGEEK